MANSIVRLPSGYFPDPDRGRPLFSAKIYIGEPDLDPRILANQKTVTGRQEDGTEIPLSQPIKTSAGGVPVDSNGNYVTLLVDGDYSMAVDDKNDNQVYYFANVLDGAPLTITDMPDVFKEFSPDYSCIPFNNISDAKSGTLKNGETISLEVGDCVKTAGYYSPNGGGGAEYIVVAGGTGTDDGGSYHNMSNGLQLELIVQGGEVDIGVFGAYGVPDGQVYIRKCLEFAHANDLITVASQAVTVTAFEAGIDDQPYKKIGAYSITGGNIVNVTNTTELPNQPNGYETEGDAQTRSNTALAQLLGAINTGNGGYGSRINYHQTVDNPSAFSIGQGIVSKTDGSGQTLSQWLVQSTPTDNAKAGGYFGQEVNPINVQADQGYSRRRGLLDRWTGGIQVVPEGKDLTRTGSNDCYPVTFGFCVAHSKSSTTSGPQAKTYNGVMIERGAIAQDGVGLQVAGTDLSDPGAGGDPEWNDLPAIGLRIDSSWGVGIDLQDGVFTNDVAMRLAEGQSIAMGAAIFTTGTGTPEGVLTAPVGSLYTRIDGGAGTTLYVKESGAGNTGWVAK